MIRKPTPSYVPAGDIVFRHAQALGECLRAPGVRWLASRLGLPVVEIERRVRAHRARFAHMLRDLHGVLRVR